MQLGTLAAKLAGLGGFAVAVAVVVVYAGFLFLTHPVPYGGENPIVFVVGAISVGVACLMLIAVHVVIGKKLFS
ncbi:MAG TPA: hypothetical protein VNW46_01860 [Gemmatimonadaceae bacterium]|nr:hypothetical protein [Gemmatimonadaceae bacterium]